MRERFSRFVKYMEYKGLNDNQVTVQCNLSQGLLGQARTGKSDLGVKTIDKILKEYPDLNKVWLLTGEGNMIVPKLEESGSNFQLGENVEMGSHSNFNDTEALKLAFHEIAAQRKLTEKAQEMESKALEMQRQSQEQLTKLMDRFMTFLENQK